MEQSQLQPMLNRFLTAAPIHIDILTFNYTKTIEKIIGEKFSDIEIGKKGSRSVYLRNIEHIHQYLGDSLILGVNDISQIENSAFSDAEEIVEVIVKPENNIGQGHGRDLFCKNTIATANLIVVFGTSIGNTDKTWWEQIGNRIGPDCSVILFDRGTEVAGEHVSKKRPYKRKIQNRFLSIAGLDGAGAEAKRKYLYVAITDRYFDLQESE